MEWLGLPSMAIYHLKFSCFDLLNLLDLICFIQKLLSPALRIFLRPVNHLISLAILLSRMLKLIIHPHNGIIFELALNIFNNWNPIGSILSFFLHGCHVFYPILLLICATDSIGYGVFSELVLINLIELYFDLPGHFFIIHGLGICLLELLSSLHQVIITPPDAIDP